jgi:beta-galactosidase beta subunit
MLDLAMFNGGSYYEMDSQSFQLFFPSDAHRPNIAVAATTTSKRCGKD